MRLVAWNANHNNRRRSLEQTATLLAPLQPDVLVLSETAPPQPDNPLGALWVGEAAPGLAVIARDGLSLSASPDRSASPPLSAAFRVSGRIGFGLVAAWPVQYAGGLPYHRLLMETLDRHRDVLGCTPAILAGDLNSSTRVAAQRRSHPQFVERAHALGLVSAYHFQTGELHGEERTPTYLHASGQSREFHLDYCFVSQELAACCTISVLRGGEWPSLSDHFPVVLDIPDQVLTTSSCAEPLPTSEPPRSR